MRVRVDIASGFREVLASAGLDGADALLARPADGLVARHARRCTQVVHVDGRDGRVTLYVKRWFRRPVRDAVRDLLALKRPRSAAAAERRALDALAGPGLGAPRWVALAVVRRWRLPGSNALVVLGEPDARPLDAVIAEAWARLDRAARRALIHRTADAVAALHRAGFRHRDLYTKHLLLRDENGGRVVFVDVTRLERRRRLSEADRARDLAALDVSTARRIVSRTDRLRWLRRYLGVMRLDARARRLVRRMMPIRRRLARRTALREYQ